MKDLLHKAIGILKIEMQDLEDDVLDLLEIYERRRHQKEITDYVYLENKSLMLHEIAGFKCLLLGLNELDTRKFSSAQEMFDEIDRQIQVKTREGGYPQAVYSLVKRRLDKVAKYLTD